MHAFLIAPRRKSSLGALNDVERHRSVRRPAEKIVHKTRVQTLHPRYSLRPDAVCCLLS